MRMPAMAGSIYPVGQSQREGSIHHQPTDRARIASAHGPCQGATRLLRCAPALRVTRASAAAQTANRAERFPSGPFEDGPEPPAARTLQTAPGPGRPAPSRRQIRAWSRTRATGRPRRTGHIHGTPPLRPRPTNRQPSPTASAGQPRASLPRRDRPRQGVQFHPDRVTQSSGTPFRPLRLRRRLRPA